MEVLVLAFVGLVVLERRDWTKDSVIVTLGQADRLRENGMVIENVPA